MSQGFQGRSRSGWTIAETTGAIPGDHYLPADPRELLWGRLPCAADAPALSAIGMSANGFGPNLAYTTVNVFFAVIAGGAIGTVVGLASARRPVFRAILNPIVSGATSIPFLVMAPFFLVWFGVGRASGVLLVTLYTSVILIIFSPVVSGKPADPKTGLSASMITDPSIDFHWFPLDNPGLVSIPLAFFLGWLGSVTSKEFDAGKYAEMEVRSLTGHGVAEALEH